ncbi:MAG: UDP-N-acetylmuramate:L-alanyl-gamma-D-glutamyl-meso-diaminopimelate ligase [Gammaproteobacteria bacterium]
MKIHILGICGTFMGGLALLARSRGHEVSGSDANAYPPMSTHLRESGIRVLEGYDPAHLDPAPDQVVIGNTLSRGDAVVEYVLDQNLPYISGPQWLAEHILAGRHVLAVAGTHGKTTTTSMLAWILDCAGLEPGYLIGGIAENFGNSARDGRAPYFVIEADEYDTAFFDKRSKFIHYHPRTLIINNIEFDHADIFGDIEDIKREFHRLLRIVPGSGRILHRHGDTVTTEVLAMGCWTPVQTFGGAGGDWRVTDAADDYSRFAVARNGREAGRVTWDLIGGYNADNALAAIAAAAEAGVDPAVACEALGRFRSVKRRLQKLVETGGVSVYDDFAHHPTAVRLTLEALRAHVGEARIIAVLEPRSNTMKMGVHRDTLGDALSVADRVLLYHPPELEWDLNAVLTSLEGRGEIHTETEALIQHLTAIAAPGDHILIMSNGGFENLHRRFIERLQQAAS